MFVVFKNDRGILDYNKLQPRPKIFCVSSFMVPLFDIQSVIVTFHGHSYFLAYIVFFSGMIKYFYWQKRSKLSQENIFKLK